MNEQLSAAVIRRFLRDECVLVQAEDTVDSTNAVLKAAVRNGDITAPCLLAANAQTAGRGRLGRAFVSPAGTGLYMSLFYPLSQSAEPGGVTILAAVAACRAIEDMTGAQPKIKWVNDLFLRGKKICGILAEGVAGGVIVGVGVNVLPPPGGFPKEAAIAGAIGQSLDRSELAGRIGAYLLAGLHRPGDASVIAAYRARMPLVGREITYLSAGIEKHARVTGVADDGGLMVEGDDGPQTLRTGEVTLGSQSFAGLE